jgi:hypothetical protein
MHALGRPTTAAGVASLYAGVISAMVVDAGDPDEPPPGIETLRTPTLMSDADSRRSVAEAVLEYARSLAAP